MGLLNAGRDTVKRGSGKPRAVVYRSGGNAPAPIAVGMKRKQEKRDANRARYLREAGMGDMVRKEKSQTKSLDRMAVQSLRQSQALGSKAHVSRGLRGTNVGTFADGTLHVNKRHIDRIEKGNSHGKSSGKAGGPKLSVAKRSSKGGGGGKKGKKGKSRRKGR